MRDGAKTQRVDRPSLTCAGLPSALPPAAPAAEAGLMRTSTAGSCTLSCCPGPCAATRRRQPHQPHASRGRAQFTPRFTHCSHSPLPAAGQTVGPALLPWSLEASSGNAPGCTAAQTRPRQPHCRARSCCAESRLRLNSCNMRPRPRAQATRTPRAHANRRRQPAADPCCSSSRWRSATCAARKGNKGLYMGGWGGCAQRRAKGVARGAASYGLRLEQRRLGKGGRGEATPHGARHESRCATQGVGRCGVDKPVFMARRPAAQPLLY